MDDRWAFPIPLTMQRQAGSAPKTHGPKSPPVAPCAEADQGKGRGNSADADDGAAATSDIGFDY